MNLKTIILTALMCATTMTTFAQKTISVEDITTKNIFKPAIVKVSDYLKSSDEKKSRYELKKENVEYIYRRSYTAEYTLKDNNTGKEFKLQGKLKTPTFSPDYRKLAYVRDNNLYVLDIEKHIALEDFKSSELAITHDGQFNHVINGFADWVYEEEFKRTRMFAFTADGSALAWVRFDESDVKEYTMQFFEGENYPRNYSYKYPKAGEPNSKVSLHTYTFNSGLKSDISMKIDEEDYIPVIETIPGDASNVLVCTMNRHQDEMRVWKILCKAGKAYELKTVKTECYLPEETVDNFTLHPDGFVIMNDNEGCLQPYLYSYDGKETRRLIEDRGVVVTEFYGYDSKTKNSYFQAVGNSPMQRIVCKADKNGKVTVLSKEEGWNSATFSDDYTQYVLRYSNKTTPDKYTFFDGKRSKVIEENEALKKVVAEQTLPQTDFFSFTTSEGVTLNGVIYKPADFDKNKKYPLIIHQYSGPGSQQVMDNWAMGSVARGSMFEALLCQHGYICIMVDPRGTAARGAEFQKLTYQTLGKLESRDMVEAAQYMAKKPYIDDSRIAIWGWSYGGFNTLMSMSEGRPVFCCGVAIAPPTDYRFYDTVYTERFMRTPQENPDGYGDNPINRANTLHGELLLCHGVVDDNVHPQNSFEYMSKLVELNRPFDMHWFTNSNHSIYNGNSRRFLLEKVVSFFDKNLSQAQ